MQLNIMGNNWLDLINLLEKILISTEIVYHLINKKIFTGLIEERYSRFRDLEKIINPNNLIHQYKIEEMSPKDFSNYQNPNRVI